MRAKPLDKLRSILGKLLASKDLPPLLIISAINAFLVLRSVSDGGYLINADHPCRFAESWYMADELLSNQLNPFGWNPYLQTGLPMFRFGPTFLPMLMVALTRLYIFTSPLPAEFSYNFVYSLCYILFPISAYLFAGSLGMGIPGKILFSSLLSFTFAPFPGFIYFSLPNASMIVGVWPYTVGVMFAFLANSKFCSLVRELKVKGLVEYASLAAMTALSNILATFGMGFMSLSIIAKEVLKARSTKRGINLLLVLSIAAALAIGFSSFYLLPTLLYGDHMYILYADPPDLLTRNMIYATPFVFPWFKSLRDRPGGWFLYSVYLESFWSSWVLCTAGLVMVFISRRECGIFFVVLTALSLFGASGGLSPPVPQYLRFLDFTRIAMFGLAGMAVDMIYERLSRRGKSLAWAAVASLLLFSLLPQVQDCAYFFSLAESSKSEAMNDVRQVLAWLRERSEKSGAIWLEDTTFWDNPVDPMNQLWFSHAFGAAFMEIGNRRVYGGFYGFWYKPFWDSWQELNYNIYWKEPPEIHELLLKYDVHYVVVFSDVMKSKLSSSDDLFREDFSSGNFKIYQVVGFKDNFAFATMGSSVEVLEFKPNLIRVKVAEAKQGERLVIKMAYMPNWHASSGEAELNVEPEQPAFTSVSLPRGAKEIVLSFRPTGLELLSWFLSIASWAAAAFLLRFYGDKDITILPYKV